MKRKLKNITVLYNLPEGDNPDDVDTQNSAKGVNEGLKQAGYKSDIFGVSPNDISSIKSLKADLVFNLVEWAGKEYVLGVEVIETLEKYGFAYTGSNAWGYKVSCDKVLMKKLLVENDIKTPKYLIFTDRNITASDLKFPLIVKPSYEHAAIGISQKSVVENETELIKQVTDLLDQYNQPILVEEYIPGDEAQVTILQKNGLSWVLPPAVFRYQKKPGYWPINTYEAKWNESSWEGKMSKWDDSPLPETVSKQIEDLARRSNDNLGGRSYSRVDLRLRGDEVFVLEINNNPGIDFDPESGITYSSKKVGLDWPGLLTNIVEEAYAQNSQKTSAYDSPVL